jgi:Restriction endonuclease
VPSSSTSDDYFKTDPSRFEHCAAAIAALLDPNIIVDEVTRASVDGGRDAIGRYRVGPIADPIYMDFALEAKCYQPGLEGGPPTSVGVKEVSRLISRLRHRQFGILITTSVIARQAYEEIREDKHPVVLLCGRDIANLLISKGINSREGVLKWLCEEFPMQGH